ncbi:hypothetical protein SLS58_002871 [Diplodia intermedia]|uniref:Uncharacterized protein n=1 Tax=Diplodia intermedia TaxID=856260 RepID=A0ABR3TXV3_9PEZI
MLKDPATLEEACIPAVAGWMQLHIAHKKNYLLQDPNGLELAVLNQKTANALQSLDTLGAIRYEAYVTVQYWTAQINTAKGTATNTMVDIEVNINGPLDRADEVGRALSKAGVFLQRPSVLPSGTPYHNPHVIHLSGIQEPSVDPAIPEAPGLADSSTGKLDIQAVLSCLDQSGDLIPTIVDERIITTKLKEHCAPGAIEYLKYHGSRRPKELKAILDKEVVLTTYETVSAEFVRGDSPLYKVAWFRIVLDEAHYICGQQTKRFCAASALQAQHRWCMTGTPIQNRLDDLCALIRFLKVPYLDNAFSFGNYISKPIEQNQSYGVARLRSLLKSIYLRRTTELLTVPEPTISVRRLDFTDMERQSYNDVAVSYKRAMDEIVSGRRKGNSQLGLCQATLRLRRFCNNGHSASAIVGSTAQNAEDMFGYLQQTGKTVCTCCSKELNTFGDAEDPHSGVFASCLHLFCPACIYQFQANSPNGGFQCPTCGTWSEHTGTELGDVSQQISPSFNGVDCYNTKLVALHHDIIQYQQSEKGIIFTSWRDTISVISSLLKATGIDHRIVEGSMSIPDRKASLEQFQSDPNCTILLMTFGTGSAGLNLTAASRIHIVEPQWNPSVESQAIGRAVRLGQEKDVTVTRYIMKNTVEEYMENVQTRKAQMASIGWDADKDKAADEKLKLVAKMVFDPETSPDVEMD